jgi:membrane peptidoglycan carboxypeptidase
MDVENQPEVGADKVVEAARRAGIPDNVVIDPVLSATLGVASPTALDMASAYATFAADGVRTSPTSIARIVGSNGGVLYDLSQAVKRTQVIDPTIVSQVDYALQKVVTSGTGTKARAVGRPVAGKTGTTDSNLSAWFVGYTPQLSTAVVMFRTEPDGKTRKSMNGVGGLARVNGGSFPASIWTSYMKIAVKGMPVVAFPVPTVPLPTTSPSPTTSPTPSTSGSPTPSPSESLSFPGSPSPSPTPSGTPTPTISPSPPAGAPVAPGDVPGLAPGILGAGDRRLLGAAGSR